MVPTYRTLYRDRYRYLLDSVMDPAEAMNPDLLILLLLESAGTVPNLLYHRYLVLDQEVGLE